jgi:hypothetical protein
MFEIKNCWMDFYETLYEHYAVLLVVTKVLLHIALYKDRLYNNEMRQKIKECLG